VVRLTGEADVGTPELGAVLGAEAAKRPRVLAVEVSGLTFMGSSALHVLVGAHRELTGAGCVLALVSPSGQVARVLSLSGAGQSIPVCGSVAEAAALVAGEDAG
jgi:anti-anti-sigma factor